MGISLRIFIRLISFFWIDTEYKTAFPRLDFSSKENILILQLAGPHDLPRSLRNASLFETQDDIVLTFIRAAKIAERLGVSAININMGSVALYQQGGGQGGGMSIAENMELAEKIVKGIKEQIKIPLSVKTRIQSSESWEEGVLKVSPDLEKTERFIRRITKAGADWVDIHTRTRAETTKSGKAKEKWHYLKTLQESNPHIIIFGNGEIDSLDSAKEFLSLTKVHGVMVSTKMLEDPSLLGRMKIFIERKYGERKEYPSVPVILSAAYKELYYYILRWGVRQKHALPAFQLVTTKCFNKLTYGLRYGIDR